MTRPQSDEELIKAVRDPDQVVEPAPEHVAQARALPLTEHADLREDPAAEPEAPSGGKYT